MDRACEALRTHWKRTRKVERADVLRAALRAAVRGARRYRFRGSRSGRGVAAGFGSTEARGSVGPWREGGRSPRATRSKTSLITWLKSARGILALRYAAPIASARPDHGLTTSRVNQY